MKISKREQKKMDRKDRTLYCVKILPSGRCVELNRNYKPVGKDLGHTYVDYEDYAFEVPDEFADGVGELCKLRQGDSFFLWVGGGLWPHTLLSAYDAKKRREEAEERMSQYEALKANRWANRSKV